MFGFAWACANVSVEEGCSRDTPLTVIRQPAEGSSAEYRTRQDKMCSSILQVMDASDIGR